MIGERTPTLLSPNGESLVCVELSTPAERDALRTFCAEHAVRLDRARFIRERFYTTDSRCFALRHGDRTFACAELQSTPGIRDELTLTHLVSAPIIDELAILDNFIAAIVETLQREAPRQRLTVDGAWLRVGAQLPDGVVVGG